MADHKAKALEYLKLALAELQALYPQPSDPTTDPTGDGNVYNAYTDTLQAIGYLEAK